MGRTDERGKYKQHRVNPKGVSIHDSQFKFIHKLFFKHEDRLHDDECRKDCKDRHHSDKNALFVDAEPEDFKPMYMYEIDKNSLLFDSDVSQSSEADLEQINEEISQKSD